MGIADNVLRIPEVTDQREPIWAEAEGRSRVVAVICRLSLVSSFQLSV